VEKPVHAVGAEHVRDLVRVDHGGGGPEREHKAGELVQHQLRGLEVHVGVDEAGDDVAAARVQLLGPFVLAETGDEAVHDRDVGFEPLAREHRQDEAAAHDEIGGLVAARDRQPTRELVHGATIPRPRRGEVRLPPMDVLTPRSLDEALRLKAERPEAVPIQGGTDLMVELNFDRARPPALLNLNEVEELRGWSRHDDAVFLGAGLTYTEAMQPPLADLLPALAEASRTVGGPQIRNRGTIGGNLATSSPAGDAMPPLLVAGADVKLVSLRTERVVRLEEFLVGPKRNVLA